MNKAALAALAATLLFSTPVAGDAGDDTMGMNIPEHWRELPKMVPVAPKQGPFAVVTRKAWGDPVGGVFLSAQTLETSKKARANELRAALVEGLGKAEIQLEQPDPAAEPLVLAFSNSGFRGRIIAATESLAKGKLRVSTVACFYNQRETDLSEQLCNVLLTQFAASH